MQISAVAKLVTKLAIRRLALHPGLEFAPPQSPRSPLFSLKRLMPPLVLFIISKIGTNSRQFFIKQIDLFDLKELGAITREEYEKNKKTLLIYDCNLTGFNKIIKMKIVGFITTTVGHACYTRDNIFCSACSISLRI